MLTKIRTAIRRNEMLHGGETVLVALSGGADSVSLLLAMLELRDSLCCEVEAIHVNHHLRGEESERDAAFCTALCKRLAVPLRTTHCDVTARATKTHTSTEEAARALRYEIFAAQTETDARLRIATAHNAQDNTETILLNLTRGTALKGLCGIPPVRGAIIRPLLLVTRSEILAYLAARQQPYVTDSTNFSDAYTRNQLRHHVIPVLTGINPALHRTIQGTVSVLSAEQDYLAQETARFYTTHLQPDGTLTGLGTLHPAIRRRCIHRFLVDAGLSASYALVDTIDALVQTGGKHNPAAGVYLLANQGMLSLVHTAPPLVAVPRPLQIGENRIFPGYHCDAALQSIEKNTFSPNVHKMFAISLLDYDKIKGTAVFRGRLNGDTIQLAGRNFHASLRKLLQAKIPAAERTALHCLADDDGLIWVERIGIADRVKPDTNTTTGLYLTVSADTMPTGNTAYLPDDNQKE